MRYLSVCSGIEAASVAWHPLGWQPAGFSEIEPFPRAVLEQRFGAVPVGWDHRWHPGSNIKTPLFGDFTQIEAHHVGPIDLLVGGTPCQDFSIAGLRAGLAGERGNLTLEFLRLAQRLQPRWIVWENVPGVLSSDGGRALGSFLGGLGQLGYRWAYRVLDAQYVRVGRFGRAVPQRRRRVFVVGHLGADGINPAAVLFDRKSLRGNPAPRRQAGEGIAADVAPSLVSSGRGVGRTGETRGQDPVVAVQSNSGDVGYCLTASAQNSLDAETETLIAVAHILRAEGFDAGEDGTGRQNLVPIAFDTTQITSKSNYSNPQPGDPCRPLAAGAHAPCIAFDCKGTEVQVSTDGSHPTLRSMGSAGSHQNAGGHAAVAYDLRGREGGAQLEGPHETANIRAASGGSSRSYVAEQWAVRRLTPTECERLQGFPDGLTNIEWRGKPNAPDGPRYKALGNSMAVNVMTWIGERIAAVEHIQHRKETLDA